MIRKMSRGTEQIYHEGSNREQMREENCALLMDIVDLCNRSDRKGPESILLLGKSGVGKSALINTIIKALTGQYIQKAKVGAGVTQSKTLHLARYPCCGVIDDDFVNKLNRDILKRSLAKLPTIFDADGKDDIDTPELEEILQLVIGGYIPNGTSIEALENIQKNNYTGALKDIYNVADLENRVSKIIYVQSCTDTVPKNLITCLQKVLKLTDPKSQQLLYTGDVYVVFTKYDLVQDQCKFECDSMVNGMISMGEFEAVENSVAQLLNIQGALEYNRIRWASYTDREKFDNPYIDNIALKFLKCMLQPGAPKAEVVKPALTYPKQVKLMIKTQMKTIRQEISFSCTNIVIVLVIAVVLAFVITMLMTPIK